LNAEITDEIGLIGVGGIEAASGHEEKDHRAMDFVASAKVYSGLDVGRMESTLGIELHVYFEFLCEIVAEDKAADPAVLSLVGKLITDFVIHTNGAEFLGEFEGQEEGIARGGDPTPDCIVGIVKEELGESRDGEARLPGVVEPPLDSGIGLTQAKFSRGRGIMDA